MTLRVANQKPYLHNDYPNNLNINSVKCAVVISNKVSKKAVKRNSLRRLFHMHLAIRLSTVRNQAAKWVLITLKPHASDHDSFKLLEECDKLIYSAGLLR